MIKIDVEFTTQYGVFRDAIYLPEDHQFTQQEIDQMKQQRLDNWITAITTPPPPSAEPVTQETQTVEIDGETYTPLNTTKLIQRDGIWYYKV
jgi:hypothetical protein